MTTATTAAPAIKTAIYKDDRKNWRATTSYVLPEIGKEGAVLKIETYKVYGGAIVTRAAVWKFSTLACGTKFESRTSGDFEEKIATSTPKRATDKVVAAQQSIGTVRLPELIKRAKAYYKVDAA